MIKPRTTTFGKRILRRTLACFLALIGLWMLSLTIPASSPFQWMQAWGGNARIVTAALAAQLNVAPGYQAEAPTSGWQRVLLSESALLAGWNQGAASGNVQDMDSDDASELYDLTATVPEHIVERFFQVTGAEGYENVEGVYIQNRTSKALDVQALAAGPVNITLASGEAPQILIIHTHGTESYTMDGDDIYVESGTARTTDTNYNIIRVGDEIERIFTEMGLSVIHDTGLYDYPNYNGSYDRSKAAIEWYLSEYPSIQIVLDVHRDAIVDEDGTVYKAVTEIDGVKTAQVLMVMGSDDGGASHPNWSENLTLAMRIQHRMNTLWPDLSRPITLRSSRFNQQLTSGSILVEIGSHGNTLEEALAGARLFARSAGQVFLELKE